MMKSAGYTLIEIMVALAVFAILAAITSSAMYHAFDTRARINRQSEQLNALQQTIALLNQDTLQAIDRSIHGQDMHSLPAFIGRQNYTEFTRGGFVNPSPEASHSALERVGYICTEKKLIRLSWDNPDLPDRKQHQERVLLTHLDDCSFAYLSSEHRILPEWLGQNSFLNSKQYALPLALQLTLRLTPGGKVSLLFAFSTGETSA